MLKQRWRWAAPGVGLVAVSVLCCAGCSAGAATAPSPAPGTTTSAVARPTRVGPVPASPPPPVTGTATANADQSTLPPPAAPRTDPAVFADPVAVATAWMAQWCAFDWQEPNNANLDRAAPYQTRGGQQVDRRLGADDDGYRRIREQRLSGRCEQVTAAASPEAPADQAIRYLLVTAQRTNLSAGVLLERETVASLRIVRRQPDGRWLVDVAVEAG